MKDNVYIGEATLVMATDGFKKPEVVNRKIVTKYEITTNLSSTYHGLSIEELRTEHEELEKECKDLKRVWGS